MGWRALVLAVVAGGAVPAAADDSLAISATATSTEAVPGKLGPSFRQRLEDEITRLGETLDEQLKPLTFEAVGLRFDGRGRRARLRVGAESRYLSLRIVGDVHLRGGLAAVDASVSVGVAGTMVVVALPNFELVPRSYLGERYVEVRVPIVRGSF